jgi:hypothetical protein
MPPPKNRLLQQKTGLEPATFDLRSRRVPTELRPRCPANTSDPLACHDPSRPEEDPNAVSHRCMSTSIAGPCPGEILASLHRPRKLCWRLGPVHVCPSRSGLTVVKDDRELTPWRRLRFDPWDSRAGSVPARLGCGRSKSRPLEGWSRWVWRFPAHGWCSRVVAGPAGAEHTRRQASEVSWRWVCWAG